MLSKTARNLYWLGRYVQRAESTSRVLEAAQRMALQSGSELEAATVAAIHGVGPAFAALGPDRSLQHLNRFMALDPANPASIVTSLRAARDNARAERNNLTTDVWESLNGLWLEVQQAARMAGGGFDFPSFIEHVKRQTILIGGAAQSTMLRDDAYDFLALGFALERADNVARILDVKFHTLLPDGEPDGAIVDYYSWAEILACIGALRTYRRVYRARIDPRRVAELMVLRHDVPRSLHYCLRQAETALADLADTYGARGEAQRLAGELHARLRYGRIDAIFRAGLHAFLAGFVGDVARLSDEIARQYLFV